MAREYLVVVPHIIGTPANWETVYSFDRVRKATREGAIRHGWREHGHDDWLIAIVEGNTVVGLAWMDKDRDDLEERADVARQLGLEVSNAA